MDDADYLKKKQKGQVEDLAIVAFLERETGFESSRPKTPFHSSNEETLAPSIIYLPTSLWFPSRDLQGFLMVSTVPAKVLRKVPALSH